MSSVVAERGTIHLGLDVHKNSISVGVLDPGEEVPRTDRISSDDDAVRRLVARFDDPRSRRGPRRPFAGPDDQARRARRSRMIRVLQRALAVLECFSDEKPRMTLQEISQAISLPKTTTFRILATLVGAGYLVQLENQSYGLSHKLMTLASIAQAKKMAGLTSSAKRGQV